MCTCVDWVQLAQNSVQWRILVNAVKNYRAPLKAMNFERLSASQEGLYSME